MLKHAIESIDVNLGLGGTHTTPLRGQRVARAVLSVLLVELILAAGIVGQSVRAAISTTARVPPASRLSATSPKETIRPRTREAYGNLPVSFEANAGQADSRVKFIARGDRYGLMLAPTEAVIQLRSAECGVPIEKPDASTASSPGSPCIAQSAPLILKFIGASSASKTSGLDQLPGKTNYLVGDDPSEWRANIPTYEKVRCEGVYPGIDLVYYGNQQRIKYDLIVAPGANPASIAFEMRGANSLTIDRAGALVAHTSAGELRQDKPFIYQESGGVRREIEGRFVMLGKRRVGFRIGGYDRSRALVIDPQISTDPRLKSSLKFGGSDNDTVNSIAIDSQGNTYVTGETRSGDYPTVNPFSGARRGNADAFVTKLNAEGTAIVYSTYLGGSAATDTAFGIAVDASGSAYVAGFTFSNDFPTTPAAFQTAKGANSDAYLVKLNPSGDALIYSTFLGGSGFDAALSVAVDSDGNAFAAGQTNSNNFPTMNAFQPSLGGATVNGFVTKLNSTGTGLLYSTYLGGSGGAGGTLNGDNVSDIAIGRDESAYVVGSTASTNFPTTAGAFQAAHGGGVFDAFVSKLNPFGALAYSTYLGGNNDDVGVGIAIDQTGSAYVTGGTGSANFPTTPGAFQTAIREGAGDAYVTKLNSSGTAPVYSTFLGGTGGEVGAGIAVDESGSGYITGTTNSSDFPTNDPLQNSLNGPSDVFVTKINATGSGTELSTYVGGSAEDRGSAIALNTESEPVSARVAGATRSRDFPGVPIDDKDKGDQPFVFEIGNDESSKADLDVCILGPDAVNNQEAEFEIMVANNGHEPATDVELTVEFSGPTVIDVDKKDAAACGKVEKVGRGKFRFTCTQEKLEKGAGFSVTLQAFQFTFEGDRTGAFTTTARVKAKEASLKTDTLVTRNETGDPPTIVKVEPMSAHPGEIVTIRGFNLLLGAVVNFNGTRAEILPGPSSAKALQVRVPRDAKTGKITVTTTTGAGERTATSHKPFEVLPLLPPPEISSFRLRKRGDNPKRLTIEGKNFMKDAVIKINGTAVRTNNDEDTPGTSLNSKEGAKQINAGDEITVVNPDGQSSPAVKFKLQ